jgi:hypothetical protein
MGIVQTSLSSLNQSLENEMEKAGEFQKRNEKEKKLLKVKKRTG